MFRRLVLIVLVRLRRKRTLLRIAELERELGLGRVGLATREKKSAIEFQLFGGSRPIEAGWDDLVAAQRHLERAADRKKYESLVPAAGWASPSGSSVSFVTSSTVSR